MGVEEPETTVRLEVVEEEEEGDVKTIGPEDKLELDEDITLDDGPFERTLRELSKLWPSTETNGLNELGETIEPVGKK